ncbi:uncharacterized protein TNCV_3411021 [Trichonephila clavipes]|nr:uncharacterized protein TNCV_3411021 [Trichonephila clavipes]
MCTKDNQVFFKRFEEPGKLGVQPGRGRKRITTVLADAVKTVVDAKLQTSEFRGSITHAVSRLTGYSYSTVRKVLRNLIHYFSYKICHTQELLDWDKPQRLPFAVSLLNRISVGLPWPWNILWSDEAHFYFDGTVNIQNIYIQHTFGLRKIHGSIKNFPYNLQRSFSGVDSWLEWAIIL